MTDVRASSSTHRFADRHVGPRSAEISHMLEQLGYQDLDELMRAVVPQDIIAAPGQPEVIAMTETEALAELKALEQQNSALVQMIGLGYSDTITPAVIRRNVVESPAWYTSYTPYQPEISQGRLEALLNFQTVVSELTALPIANASLLDEATAVAEAVLLMRRAVRGRDLGVVILDEQCHPQTIAVTVARAQAVGLTIVLANVDNGLPTDLDPTTIVGCVAQQPGTSGAIRDLAPLIAEVHEAGGLMAVAADLLAMTMVVPPGEQGADIAVGSAQRFGVPLFYGGPHAGYLAVRQGLERQIPGRMVGVSKDAHGNTAFRLALQTREQHIRREKATSNICTAQALLAVVASMYAVWHGPEGLREIAEQIHDQARELAHGLARRGIEVVHEQFFDTVLAEVEGQADALVEAALRRGINIRAHSSDQVVIACSETTTTEHLAALLDGFDEVLAEAGMRVSPAEPLPDFSLNTAALRTSHYLDHPVFHRYHSETAMLRYLRDLSDRDLALDRTMIPLGSCTMKLNATAEMEPITWPGFANIHPYAPRDQASGYATLIATLEQRLASLTGYAAVSVQPNSGAMGEYAGLMAIRGYHGSRSESNRDICLIPASAHGTNAASAVLAGLTVEVVDTADDGSIDLASLAQALEKHGPRVAAIMITYPSTHGVYEETVREVCDLVHRVGGQVYIDGANFNALTEFARPGEFGGDVSHLNLHKTFAIPHGGGGPGVGPIGVREHLVPFLPGSPLPGFEESVAGQDGLPHGLGGSAPVAGAPFGSAGVLPITWAYLAMMGTDGLRSATATAVLNANYLAHRLGAVYPVLYTGRSGLVAHECIFDLREITKSTGVTAEDVAKRLVDYGFHAPTMSFPVAGTLMVEPTESEDLAELDRFCDAMLAIGTEIVDIAEGRQTIEDSPLRNAPHTAQAVTVAEWEHKYSRNTAVFPPGVDPSAKYWPPVARIDNAFGDRNLHCVCPPIEEYRS